MPAELLTRNDRTAPPAIPISTSPDDALREWARQHVERARRLKLHVVSFVVGMVVLTPLWVLVEWQANGGFERWSDNSQPGDWEPWILYVALVWGLVVAIAALKVYFDRPTTEAEIDREVERLTSSR
ncbi:MAG TPA: 2TM domain-containing protein [Gaiellaceae bacterium]|nr:2TM domain-containing protein [Gaiellaceae bacterium]